MENPRFTYESRVTLRDADAGGVLFFARYLALAHEAFAAFLASRGIGFPHQLSEGDYVCSVVHAECDYRWPLRLGDTVHVELALEEVARRTFTVAYALRNGDGRLCAQARTVHAPIRKDTRRAMPLAPLLRAVLTGASPDQ